MGRDLRGWNGAESAAMTNLARPSAWRRALLWIAAFLLTVGAAAYQRRTGPTYPYRGTVAVGGEEVRYRLLRSAETSADARVELPAPASAAAARLHFRRLGTGEEWTAVPCGTEESPAGRRFVGLLPRQPAAGKLEYYLEIESPAGNVRIPAAPAESIVMRYKDPVWTPLLVTHVAMMVIGLLVGLRAALGAILAPYNIRLLAGITCVAITLGGMILGPFVQKQAFGAYWTGFPWGHDLTDNKTLIMWLAWLLATAAVFGPLARRAGAARVAVVLAAVVTTGVYMIPHSLRGSQLDYAAVDRGIDAKDAVRTGH